MTDEHTVVHQRSAGSAVAWLALIIGTAALVIAWLAYNRSGKDLEDSVKDTANTVIDQSGQEAQNASDAIERGIDTGPDGVDDGAR